jgi:hypothetical protein
MIVLSVGMPRAGSGWYYNLTNDLMLASGAQDARQVRRRYRLQGILTEVNCNIGALTPRRLLAVWLPSLLGNTFVIKAHAGPTPMALWLVRRRQILPAYIYRDPRDAMLSAYENGQRALAKGRANAFSRLVDFQASLAFMSDYVRISEAWLACPQALHTRYEDLLNDYDQQASRLVQYLGLDPAAPAFVAVVERYRPQSAQAQSEQKGLHFNKGKTGRFRQKMSPEEQAVLAERFGPYLERMGYAI